MPSVKCLLKSCVYRGKRGSCHRKHIVLKQTEAGLNELYCLGWATPETRLFTEAMEGRIAKNDKRHYERVGEIRR